jgi:hypothetical protein
LFSLSWEIISDTSLSLTMKSSALATCARVRLRMSIISLTMFRSTPCCFGDVAQVQQRDQRLRVGLLDRQVGVAEQDDVVVAIDLQRIEHRAMAMSPGAGACAGVAAMSTRRPAHRARLRAAPLPPARSRAPRIVEFAHDGLGLLVPAEHQGALGIGAGAPASTSADTDPARRRRAQDHGVVVLADRDDLSPAPMRVSIGGLTSTSPLPRMIPITADSLVSAEIASR